MFKLLINTTKGLLIILWSLAFLSMLSLSPLPEEYKLYVLTLACVVLVVHFIEYFTMKAKLKSKIDGEMNFMQTMLWGFGYWLPILNHKD